DKGGQLGPVEVGLLDSPCAVEAIGPIHLAAENVQCGSTGRIQPADEDFLRSGALEVGSHDFSGNKIAPVHLAAGNVQSWPRWSILTCDERLRFGAVEVGPHDVTAIIVVPVDEVGPCLPGHSEEQA